MVGLLDAFLAGGNAGRATLENRRADADQSALRGLAPQIIAGNPQAYDQAAAISPQAAQAYQGAGDAQLRRLKGAIAFIDSQTSPEAKEGAYREVRPFLARFGQEPPATFAEAQPQYEQAKARIAQMDQVSLDGAPTGYRQFDMIAKAAGLNPGTPEYQQAAKVNLGLEGRASSSGFTQVKVTGADGRERVGVLNGRTGQIDLPDGTSFNPQTGQIAPTSNIPQGGGIIDTPNGQAFVEPGLSPDQLRLVEADMAANGGSNNYQLADRDVTPQQFGGRVTGSPSAFVGLTPGEKAAQEASAKAGVELQTAPQMEAIKTQGEIDRARGTSAVKTETERAEAKRERDTTFQLYETTMKQLIEGFDGAITFPGLASLPAVTERQQIAQGGVAAAAPVLKQLFRVAGEGNFTDADQRLLIQMLPTRDDLPAARASKLKAVDAMVRAKLQQPSAPSQPPSSSTPTRIRGAEDYNALPSGATFIDPNGVVRRKR